MKNVEDYKAWYRENYGRNPSENLIESFCKLNSIPWPPERQGEETPYYIPPKAEMMFGGETAGDQYELDSKGPEGSASQ